MTSCSNLYVAKGMCGMHYQRALKHGDPSVNLAAEPQEPTCRASGCAADSYAKSYCRKHYIRFARHGDPMTRLTLEASLVPTYKHVHRKLTQIKGKAANNSCTDCDGIALDWSYVGGDPHELTSDRGQSAGFKYSLDASRYVPRCRSCHKLHDGRFS